VVVVLVEAEVVVVLAVQLLAQLAAEYGPPQLV
jgi:hypothetical protein